MRLQKIDINPVRSIARTIDFDITGAFYHVFGLGKKRLPRIDLSSIRVNLGFTINLLIGGIGSIIYRFSSFSLTLINVLMGSDNFSRIKNTQE